MKYFIMEHFSIRLSRRVVTALEVTAYLNLKIFYFLIVVPLRASAYSYAQLCEN